VGLAGAAKGAAGLRDSRLDDGGMNGGRPAGAEPDCVEPDCVEPAFLVANGVDVSAGPAAAPCAEPLPESSAEARETVLRADAAVEADSAGPPADRAMAVGREPGATARASPARTGEGLTGEGLNGEGLAHVEPPEDACVDPRVSAVRLTAGAGPVTPEASDPVRGHRATGRPSPAGADASLSG
jgi:hypothetical protein